MCIEKYQAVTQFRIIFEVLNWGKMKSVLHYIFLVFSLAYILLSVRHHKPLLIKSLSWMQAIHKDRIFWKNLIKNKEMVFGDGVKNIQAAAYNGERTVYIVTI